MRSKLRRPFGFAMPTAFNRKIRELPKQVPFMIVGICVLVSMTMPALAAVDLAYFRGRSEPSALLLEWASLREVNLARWDIYCKDESDPPSAYHLIGAANALGGPDQGYAYAFSVPELTPGLSYCFRLDEITVDGSPGESFDICGFGYGVTPTPTPPEGQGAGVVTDRAYGPGTPIPGSAAEAQPANPAPATSTPTVTPIVTQIATATATPVNASPLSTPVSGAQALPPTPTPVADSPMATGSFESAPAAQVPGSSAAVVTEAAANSAMMVDPTPIPDPGFIVVTATPTSEAVAQVLPTFTPLPTATPNADLFVVQRLEWDAETLVMALLCLVTVGATGIGVLGITSLGLYFSSRSGDRRR